jgi:precorrin-2 dehydrogenase/sirohydrochlorin ferrochelatase
MNELYPVFLKVSELKTLIVGGGAVGLEKLSFLLKSSPNAKVKLVAKEVCEEIRDLARGMDVDIHQEAYREHHLEGVQVVIAATDDLEVNLAVRKDAKLRNILVNVADNPPYCDFYMGGIVTKGNLKIAISTNGKSPTLAKRLRQFFEDLLPENVDELLENLDAYRKTLKGNFQDKVDHLNELTKGMLDKQQ